MGPVSVVVPAALEADARAILAVEDVAVADPDAVR